MDKKTKRFVKEHFQNSIDALENASGQLIFLKHLYMKHQSVIGEIEEIQDDIYFIKDQIINLTRKV